jgi:acetyltransferase-like isoleucine patch superfamily enzyme
MTNLVRSYLGFYDTVAYIAQASRGYVRTKFTLAKFGAFPVIRGAVKFQVRGEAVFGDKFTALGQGWDVRINVARGGRLTVGDRVAMNAGVSIEVFHDVRIGDNVMIAPFVSIIDDACHEAEPGTLLYKGPLVIEDNVWLANSVKVMPGVTIGAGSVIGANSVVSKDIPPNSFAAGCPAKVIKTLNIPDNWSHRYGYEQEKFLGGGVLGMLRRTFVNESGTRAGAAGEAGRDHEVVGAQRAD